MTEEYLLAWNDHHATFFSAMSDLVTGKEKESISLFFKNKSKFHILDKYESVFLL